MTSVTFPRCSIRNDKSCYGEDNKILCSIYNYQSTVDVQQDYLCPEHSRNTIYIDLKKWAALNKLRYVEYKHSVAKISTYTTCRLVRLPPKKKNKPKTQHPSGFYRFWIGWIDIYLSLHRGGNHKRTDWLYLPTPK